MADAPVKNTNQSGVPQSGRDARGRWVKGMKQKAGPGRPKLADSITQVLRDKVAGLPQLFDRWVELCKSPDEQVALRALIALANRIDGMPRQAVDTSSAGDLALADYLAELGQALREASDEEPSQ